MLRSTRGYAKSAAGLSAFRKCLVDPTVALFAPVQNICDVQQNFDSCCLSLSSSLTFFGEKQSNGGRFKILGPRTLLALRHLLQPEIGLTSSSRLTSLTSKLVLLFPGLVDLAQRMRDAIGMQPALSIVRH